VYEAIRELAQERGWSASQIYRHLENEAKDDPAQLGRVPTLRTVQRIVRDLVPADPSDRWTLAESDLHAIRPVLDALGVVIADSGGHVRSITRQFADWVVRIHRAAPDLDAWEIVWLARGYQQEIGLDRPTDYLDAFLALAPWRSGYGYRRWLKVEQSWIWPSTAPRRVLGRMADQQRLESGAAEEHAKFETEQNELRKTLVWHRTTEKAQHERGDGNGEAR
jgi:hypothetical protein